MADRPLGEVRVESFRGMATAFDPTDVPADFSQVQVNSDSRRQGELEIRRGLRPLTFDTEDA